MPSEISVIKRATLLYPSGETHHLFVVLCDPFGPAQQVVMVPACTIRNEKFDETCILQPGDHKFIKNQSYISYAKVRIEPAQKLVVGVEKREFVDMGEMSQGVFDKVLAGQGTSKFAKPFARDFLEAIASANNKKPN